jgi:hypothetical protein
MAWSPFELILKFKAMKDKRKEVRKNFLVNRDETGRLIVHMMDGTGQSYMVEFIEPKGGVRTDWGSYNPSTGKIENKKGAGKYKGGIQADESLLTPENGFPDAKIIPGASYMHSVMEKHEKWKRENGFS